jgi:hypothetical protein
MGIILEIYWKFVENLLEIYFGNLLEIDYQFYQIAWKCIGNLVEMYWKFQYLKLIGNLLEICCNFVANLLQL